MYQKDMESLSCYVASGSVFSWYPDGFSNRDLLVYLLLNEEVRMERLRNREAKRNGHSWLDNKGKYTNDFLEWCKTYLTAKDKRMPGTYAEQVYQMEISKSPIVKLDSSQPLEELYSKVFETCLSVN